MLSKAAAAVAVASLASADALNIVETAQATADLSTLVAAVTAGGLADTLSDADATLTVFAPTNAAFEALPDGILDNLLEAGNKDDLVNVLTYHVVGSVAKSTDLSDGDKVETLQGEDVTVGIADGVVKIDEATVTTPDVDCDNGVVHIVDGVLIPSNQPLKTITATAAGNADLATLVTALTAAELTDTFDGTGSFTVFAPTNAAFESLPEGVLTDLLKPENKDDLTAVLQYHVLSSKVYSSALTDGQTATTLQGSDVTVSIGDDVKINDAKVAAADVKATNGVVHVVDGVLVPDGVLDNGASASTLSMATVCAGLALAAGALA